MNGQTPWYKQKTTWTGIIAIVTAIAGAATGTLPIAVAVQAGLTGLMGIFLRQGVEKTKNQKENQDAGNPPTGETGL